jgi:hypothetical protein
MCDTRGVLSKLPTVEGQLVTLKRIKEAIGMNSSELQLAYSQGSSIETVAWRSRNLLELVIWSEHCAASKENSKEFMLDSARDAADGLTIPEGSWLRGSLQPTRQLLLDNATADGFDIEQPFTRVASAAKKLGRGDMFSALNKSFSKFAHPTAFAIFSAGTKAQELLRSKFYETGMGLANSGLQLLDEAEHRIRAQIIAGHSEPTS